MYNWIVSLTMADSYFSCQLYLPGHDTKHEAGQAAQLVVEELTTYAQPPHGHKFLIGEPGRLPVDHDS